MKNCKGNGKYTNNTTKGNNERNKITPDWG